VIEPDNHESAGQAKSHIFEPHRIVEIRVVPLLVVSGFFVFNGSGWWSLGRLVG
jgi:hypothetical protein